ncbi:MAG: hypothetical protein E7096_00620 [Bacteroides sp.]|nr:hypothetical protein [Bacteroides sp.]
MRTKHIFSTLMLAALATACSNEELELANNSNELAKGRVELGQIELALGDGVDSRYAVGPNFNDLSAEAGDELGAALIDTWTPTDGKDHAHDFKYDYTITDYIQTNYSFKYNGETWASEAKMVEGNYFFYAPYNAKHVTRASVTAKFNPVQQLALNADGTIDELSTIKQLKESGEVMAVGYKFISREDGKTVKASLLPIYAYPVISLTNNYKEKPEGSTTLVATDLIINQVVISTTNGFPTANTFKFAEALKNAISAAQGVVAALRDFTYWKSDDKPAETLKGEFAKMNGSKENYTASLMNTTPSAESSAIVVKAPANYTLKAGASTKFHVVMPAAEYNNLKVELYTNKGVFELLDGNFTIAAGKRYSKNYYNEDGTLINDAEVPTGENMIFSVAGTPATSSNIVANATDLTAMVQGFEGNADNNNVLEVQPLSEDVEINAAVMTAVKAKAKIGSNDFKLVLTAPATISANMNSSTRKVEFQKGAIVKAGEITINNQVDFTTEGGLTVKGGTVNVAAAFNVATLLVKDGNVTLNSAVAATVEGGTLTIGDEAANGEITNDGGTVTFAAGADKDHIKSYTNAVTNNKGTLTVPAYATLSSVASNGVADSKEGKINVEANGTITAITTNTNKGTINVNGTATVTTNNGLVVMGATGDATVTTNSSEINNTANGKVTADDGIIYYEFTENVEGRLIVKASTYNTIYLTGMTWTPTAEQTIAVDVVMNKANIEIWDSAAKITMTGKLSAVDVDDVDDKSYINGSGTELLDITGGTYVENNIEETPAGIVKHS